MRKKYQDGGKVKKKTEPPKDKKKKGSKKKKLGSGLAGKAGEALGSRREQQLRELGVYRGGGKVKGKK